MPRYFLALLVTAGCSAGSRGAIPAPPAAVKSANTLAAGPPLATPGERMSYQLALQGMELATYDLAVGDLAAVAGKQAIVVQSHAKAVGLVKMVANIDDTFTSWIDVTTGRPLRWQTDEFATKSTDKERTDVRMFERSGDVVPVDFHMNDESPKPEPQTVSLPDVWDYNAFLIALRSWEGAPGSTVTAEVFRSRYLWHVTMTIRGKEKVVTQLGEMPALRLDGHVFKVGRNNAKLPDDDERDFSVWISDDDGRVPLKTVARTDYGDIEMKIVDYSPGNGQRLRH